MVGSEGIKLVSNGENGRRTETQSGISIHRTVFAVDFHNVDCLRWVNLVEEPEVFDSHMPSASSHLLGLGEHQCTGVVFEDSRFGSIWNWVRGEPERIVDLFHDAAKWN